MHTRKYNTDDTRYTYNQAYLYHCFDGELVRLQGVLSISRPTCFYLANVALSQPCHLIPLNLTRIMGWSSWHYLPLIGASKHFPLPPFIWGCRIPNSRLNIGLTCLSHTAILYAFWDRCGFLMVILLLKVVLLKIQSPINFYLRVYGIWTFV